MQNKKVNAVKGGGGSSEFHTEDSQRPTQFKNFNMTLVLVITRSSYDMLLRQLMPALANKIHFRCMLKIVRDK